VQSGNAAESHADRFDRRRPLAVDGGRRCPGPKPPFLAVKRPAHPYKSAIENRSTVGNAKGA
jgi:hypothetical protein